MENKRKTFNARAAMFLPLSLAVPLALAACGQGPGGNLPVAASNGATGGVASANPASTNSFSSASGPGTGEATPLQPGRWEIHGVAESDVPRPFGAPPPANPDDAPSPRPQTRDVTVCVTPELAARPTPVLILMSDRISACTRTVWAVRDGRIDGDLTCSDRPNQPPASVRVAGSYTSDSFEAEGEANTTTEHSRVKITAKRGGECRGDEQP